MHINFNNTYIKLPEHFYKKVLPLPVKSPKLLYFNKNLAKELGISINHQDEKDLATFFSGNQLLDGSEPIALVYAGHQYGHFVPQLGDGRAILLGEVSSKNGKLYDM